MLRFFHFTRFGHRAAWLLAVGLFAMTIQAFGAIGLMHETSAGGGFRAEICTSKGLTKPVPGGQPADTSPADDSRHGCCKLCGASAPLLTADAVLGVPPAPTFSGLFFAAPSIPPAVIARVSHPPRGPPLV